MGEVVRLANYKVETNEYFGGCPHCGKNDGYLNVGREHWFVCHQHRATWWAGSNLFSAWRDETEDDWRKNEGRMHDYEVVEPIYPEQKFCRRCGGNITNGDYGAHSPLCRTDDGTPTELSDEAVKQAVAILDKRQMHIAKNATAGDDFPF